MLDSTLIWRFLAIELNAADPMLAARTISDGFVRRPNLTRIGGTWRCKAYCV